MADAWLETPRVFWEEKRSEKWRLVEAEQDQFTVPTCLTFAAPIPEAVAIGQGQVGPHCQAGTTRGLGVGTGAVMLRPAEKFRGFSCPESGWNAETGVHVAVLIPVSSLFRNTMLGCGTYRSILSNSRNSYF
jgi:hypothetical protein